jgi:hypothetical protein
MRYREPLRLDLKRKSFWDIIIKTQNLQSNERILKSSEGKGHVTYKGRPIKITPDFLRETLKARSAWKDILQPLQNHRWRENKIFQDKFKFKQYLSTNPVLHKILQGRLQPKKDKLHSKKHRK